MNITILDTGFVSNTTARASQTQLSDANRAGYTGSAVSSFTLKLISVNFASGQFTESNSIINTFTDVETTPTATRNRRLSVSLIKEKSDVTSGWNLNELHQLQRLDKTKGLKIIYPDGTGDNDKYKTLIEILGAENTGALGNFSDGSPTDDNGTVSSTTPYLVGRIVNITINDAIGSNNWWNITLEMELSG